MPTQLPAATPPVDTPPLLSSNRAISDASRRRFLSLTSAAGLGAGLAASCGSALFPGALWAQAAAASADGKMPPITDAMIEAAASIAGLHFTDAQRKTLLDGLNSQREDVEAVRALALPNAVAPALVFDPVPADATVDTSAGFGKYTAVPHVVFEKTSDSPDALEALAFHSVRELGALLRARRITSVALTKMYLARLKRLDAQLHCVITLTEDRALKQAARADAELAEGKDRGPLHGIPWGAKDLLAVAGYPTTWGAAGFEHQTFDHDATVVERLDRAGAVLIAKLSMGALAQGDLWGAAPGTRTRNPWNTKQGSSGSSAGSASAVAAGCVGFAIGTETLGSIASPSTRCGTVGLRPSFGRVPRTGAMALSWSMDKIGPIARSVEDCALVLSAITGPDWKDKSVRLAPSFQPDFTADVRKLRVGFLKSAFDAPVLTPLKPPSETLTGKDLDAFNARVAGRKANFERSLYDAQFNTKALETLRTMGLTLIEKSMPDFPFGALVPMLEAEAAAAFDDLTRSGRDALLAGQLPFDWPNQFRTARFYSAVDYIQAARARTLALDKMTALFADVDVIVAPSFGPQLTATNLTGQPAVIVPCGVRGSDAPLPPSLEDGALANAGGPGTPVSITFLAPLFGEAKACTLARAFMQKSGTAGLHPKIA